MATTSDVQTAETDRPRIAWRGIPDGPLAEARSTSATSSSRTTSPTTGDESFLAPATARTKAIWDKLNALFLEERKKGVLDVSQIPSSITAHAPGYIDRDHEVIVGLQTDAPLKRAIMPNGGFRMVVSALKTYGYTPDPHVVEAFTKYRKTHNEAVFDAYTADIRRCRSSHILTGLPDAYGRGRIIGDYRRVALYGVDAADRTQAARRRPRSTPRCPPTRSSATARSSPSRSARSRSCSRWPRATGSTSRGRRATAKEAVQWLYFGYLAAVKEQNGAAMSLGRTSTFLDIYFERDLAAGTLTEEQAQEIIDDFVIKLRIVRFLRTPEYDELFAGDPTWVTESIGGHGRRRPVAGDEDELPACCRRSTTSVPRPSRTSRSGTRRACPRRSAASPRRSRSTRARSSSRATRSCGAPGATTAPSRAACRRCSSASRCSSSAPAPTSPSACSTRSTAAATR